MHSLRMIEQNADATPEECRAALYKIAMRCAQALLVVELKARRAEHTDPPARGSLRGDGGDRLHVM